MQKYLNLVQMLLAYIDNGQFFRKPFRWLYTIHAVFCIALPLFLLYSAVQNNIFSAPFKMVVAFLLIWLLLVIAGIASALIWWDRKEKVMQTSREYDEFVATPVFAHYLQTNGEVLAIWLGLAGTGSVLIATVFAGNESYQLSRLPIPFLNLGWVGVLIFPVLAFLVLVTFRFLAEQLRALASIANNTKVCADNNIVSHRA